MKVNKNFKFRVERLYNNNKYDFKIYVNEIYLGRVVSSKLAGSAEFMTHCIFYFYRDKWWKLLSIKTDI